MNKSQHNPDCLKTLHWVAPLYRLTQKNNITGNRIHPRKYALALSALLLITINLNAVDAVAANRIYKTDFGSKSFLYLPQIAYDKRGAHQDIETTNTDNGVLSPIVPWGASVSTMQIIADATISPSTINNYIYNEIQQVIGPDGNPVNALFQNVKNNDANQPGMNGSTQDVFLILRDQPTQDTGDVYFSYWFKFQSDLKTQLNKSWRAMSEWKTDGDYRVSTSVIQDNNGNLSWESSGDNNANGDLPLQDYWQERNTTVPVPVGEWFKYEVFWHRSSSTDGRYWVAVNGKTIADHKGPNMGIYNRPINRIMLTNAYSGGKAPIQQWVTNLEIWDGFPCGIGISCYNASAALTAAPAPKPLDTTAPSIPTLLTAISKSSTQINLTWAASTDNIGVTGYKVFRDGSEIGTSTAPSYIDTKVAGGIKYSYSIKAYDGSNNISVASSIASVKTPLPVAPPVSISSIFADNITKSSAAIHWTTNIPTTAKLLYGKDVNNLNNTLTISQSTSNHTVTLSGLSTSVRYYVLVNAIGSSSAANSLPLTFRTLKSIR